MKWFMTLDAMVSSTEFRSGENRTKFSKILSRILAYKKLILTTNIWKRNNTNATALKSKQQTYNSLLVGALGLITPTTIVRKLNIKVAHHFGKITVTTLTYNEAIQRQ